MVWLVILLTVSVWSLWAVGEESFQEDQELHRKGPDQMVAREEST